MTGQPNLIEKPKDARTVVEEGLAMAKKNMTPEQAEIADMVGAGLKEIMGEMEDSGMLHQMGVVNARMDLMDTDIKALEAWGQRFYSEMRSDLAILLENEVAILDLLEGLATTSDPKAMEELLQALRARREIVKSQQAALKGASG